MNLQQTERWLARDRPRARKLQVLQLVVGSAPNMVQEWLTEEINAHESPAQTLLDTCADFADMLEESVQFTWQWVDVSGSVITATTHRQVQTDSAGTPAADAAGVSQNKVIGQFMRHDEVKEKLQITALGIFVTSFEKLLALAGKQNEALAAQNLLLQQQLQAARERAVPSDDRDREPTEEERTEVLARANAWNKVAELGPVVLNALLRQGLQ